MSSDFIVRTHLPEPRVTGMMRRIDAMFERHFKAEEFESSRGRLVGPVEGISLAPVPKKNHSMACRVAQAWAWSRKNKKTLRAAAERWDVPFARVLYYNRQRVVARKMEN